MWFGIFLVGAVMPRSLFHVDSFLRPQVAPFLLISLSRQSKVDPLQHAAQSWQDKRKEVPMHPPKGRILCAEDDHDACEVIIFTLRLNGYQVTCAETGTEALSLAKNEHFDLFQL